MNSIRIPRRYYFVPAATMILVFACGVGTGFLLGGSPSAKATAHDGSDFGPRGFGRSRGMHTRLAEDLGLSETQRTQFEAVTEREMEEIHQTCGSIRPAIEAIHERYAPLVHAILTEQQWQRFEQLRAQWRAKAEERTGERPDPTRKP